METVHPNLHSQQEQHTFQATMNFKWISANKCKFILTCQLFVLLFLIPQQSSSFEAPPTPPLVSQISLVFPPMFYFVSQDIRQISLNHHRHTTTNRSFVPISAIQKARWRCWLERWEHMLTKNLPCLLTVATFVWLRILFIDETICG